METFLHQSYASCGHRQSGTRCPHQHSEYNFYLVHHHPSVFASSSRWRSLGPTITSSLQCLKITNSADSAPDPPTTTSGARAADPVAIETASDFSRAGVLGKGSRDTPYTSGITRTTASIRSTTWGFPLLPLSCFIPDHTVNTLNLDLIFRFLHLQVF